MVIKRNVIKRFSTHFCICMHDGVCESHNHRDIHIDLPSDNRGMDRNTRSPHRSHMSNRPVIPSSHL